MTWGGLDQRVFPRISARCDISIHDRVWGAITTKTQNLGAGGVCVISNRELEKLSRVHLRIALQESVPPVECDGRVVWMVRSKDLPSGRITFDENGNLTNASYVVKRIEKGSATIVQ